MHVCTTDLSLEEIYSCWKCCYGDDILIPIVKMQVIFGRSPDFLCVNLFGLLLVKCFVCWYDSKHLGGKNSWALCHLCRPLSSLCQPTSTPFICLTLSEDWACVTNLCYPIGSLLASDTCSLKKLETEQGTSYQTGETIGILFASMNFLTKRI